jgi:Antirestriction protein (ArdA)
MEKSSTALNPSNQALSSSADFNKSPDNTPKIYVGTYAKYNNGSLFGDWFNLTDYSDYEELMSQVLEFHEDEEDPELMIQYYENFPKAFYQESWSEKNIEKLIAYADFYNRSDTDTLEAFNCFIENDGSFVTLDFEELKNEFSECYQTTAPASSLCKNETQILADYLQEINEGYIESKFKEAGISHLYSHFSWESYAHDCKCAGDYYVIKNHIFSSN